MPDRNRSKLDKYIRLGFGFAATSLIIALIWKVSADQATNTERARKHTAEYATIAEQSIDKNCATASDGVSASECAAKIIKSTREDQRSEYDLSAQKDMAKWALLMFWATALSAIIGLIGVVFLKRTLDATLKAVEDTGKATKAMEQANDISLTAVKATYKPALSITFVGDYINPIAQRYIAGGFRAERRISISACVAVKNIGRHPVTVREAFLTLNTEAAIKSTAQSFYHLGSDEIAFISPTRPMGTEMLSIGVDSILMTLKNVRQFRHNPPAVIGYIVYDDAIGIRRKKGFAFQPDVMAGNVREYRLWGGDEYNYERELPQK